MKIKFWGVCGSVPAPLTTERFRRKVSSIIQRITPEDLETPEMRERFLAQLPQSLFSVTGGNTPCIEIRPDDETLIIVDGGTGLHELGRHLSESCTSVRECHIFLTHFHWDHIQGIPFFAPAFDREWKITFYSPAENFESVLRAQMQAPYSTVSMDEMKAQLKFTVLRHKIDFAGCEVSFRKVLHPGGCFAYCFKENGKKLIVSTDTELREEDFADTDENSGFYRGADMLVLDSHYGPDDTAGTRDRGHSSNCLGVDFAAKWGIRNLVLFHFNPDFSDTRISDLLSSAQWYSRHIQGFDSGIILAREGLVLEV